MLKKSNKTKVLIKNTFIDLLKEKSFNDITVKNITDALDINRGTFYLHYEDKYQLLEEIEMEIINHIKKIMEDGTEGVIENNILLENKKMLLNTLTGVYRYIKEVSYIFGILIGPNGDIAFQWRLKSLIESVLHKNLEKLNLADTISYKYVTVIASSAQLGIIQKWIKSDFKESPEELADFMSNLINKVFSEILINEANERS